MIDKALKTYIEKKILPLYEKFDKAHNITHAQKVIDESMWLAKFYDTNENMVYAIAAWHDVGLCVCRETHHLESAKMLLADEKMRIWFSESEILTMAEAVEDHRASSKNEPRSIYGKIVAEADRDINPKRIIQRTVQFGLAHYPELSKDEQYKRFLAHLNEKYAKGGYLKLWIPESANVTNLNTLRDIIRNKKELKSLFNEIFEEETFNVCYFVSKIGCIKILDNGTAVTSIRFSEQSDEPQTYSALQQKVISQLSEYFMGKRKTFDFPIATNGTDFQKSVWNITSQIPYGETRTYTDIANKLGNPSATRAIGNALNKNPLAIVVPCHRVVGKNKNLVGYAYGTDKKLFLLNLEHENK